MSSNLPSGGTDSNKNLGPPIKKSLVVSLTSNTDYLKIQLLCTASRESSVWKKKIKSHQIQILAPAPRSSVWEAVCDFQQFHGRLTTAHVQVVLLFLNRPAASWDMWLSLGGCGWGSKLLLSLPRWAIWKWRQLPVKMRYPPNLVEEEEGGGKVQFLGEVPL